MDAGRWDTASDRLLGRGGRRAASSDTSKHITDARSAPIVLDSVEESDYDLVFYPGGHGPIQDLAFDEFSGALLSARPESGRTAIRSPGRTRDRRRLAYRLVAEFGEPVIAITISRVIAAPRRQLYDFVSDITHMERSARRTPERSG